MNDTPSRLDLDRARAALAKVRDEGAIAVRAPRPADLSRLREEADRRHRIETRAGAFRMELRSQLGLADTQGPYSPLPLNTSGVLGHALCDADICTPEPPMAAAPARPKADPAPSIAGDHADTGFAGEAPAVEPVAPETDAGWADGAPEPEAPPQRKKFLGLF
ncbi:hypothetical protein GCM10007420_13990 [Glycocaulis albus]|jgi:hypothetical protein|uniref:Uncharacterized protein n=1 Tax=Glycocaulis albus TaxID=1382801 RepID=A0ABQ1XPE6_9PROT|nr:hypothetical protein [Glycocaulis albus]GGG99339.1 hypothetical protein GCM10007420_13990 [Glycocaulis albus]